jgi:polar amino acid transport system substrate-binding protein
MKLARLFVFLAALASVQTAATPIALSLEADEGAKELVVATKIAPPFAMKDEDGKWSGISIELWQRIADELKLRYRFVEEPTVQDLVDHTANRAYGAAVAAITVTARREGSVDFSQPYYFTGLGIAVSREGPSMWSQIGRTLTSFGFAQAVLVLLGIAFLVGLLIWIFERRHNEDFGGGVLRGLGSSMWWSAEAMSQASTGFRGPRTLPGRVVAVVWMVASVVTLAVFTAGVTTALTTRKLQGVVAGVSDLPSVRVGAVTGSATVDYLDGNRIRYRGYRTPEDGLTALQAGTIDAFVYDRPLLAWTVLQQFPTSINLLEADFDPQSYAVAFPADSELREPFNVAMLEAIRSEWWKQTLFRYLGER